MKKAMRDKLIALLVEAAYKRGGGAGLCEYMADHLIANGVVIPTRCEKCFYFIPMDDVRECPLYKDYPIDQAVDMGFDGLCGNWDRWTSVDEFCSGGEEEKSE